MKMITTALIFISFSVFSAERECKSLGDKTICGYITSESPLAISFPTITFSASWSGGETITAKIKNNQSGKKLICAAFGKKTTDNTESVGAAIYYNVKKGELTVDAGFEPLYRPKVFSLVECE